MHAGSLLSGPHPVNELAFDETFAVDSSNRVRSGRLGSFFLQPLAGGHPHALPRWRGIALAEPRSRSLARRYRPVPWKDRRPGTGARPPTRPPQNTCGHRNTLT